MMNNAIHLTKNDLDKLKKIGAGTDGTVYRAKNGYLYKIYHRNIEHSNHLEDIIRDEDGVIISKYKDTKVNQNYQEPLYYIEDDGTKLHGDSSIYKAIEKQKNIINTNLPVAPIYIDKRFVGCVLKEFKYAIGIHSYFNLTSKKKQLIVLNQLLNNIKELLDNHIYMFDLHNKPDDNTLHHSNILVNLSGKPMIIDIDGKSALYRSNYDALNYHQTLTSVLYLYIDLLYNIDLFELINNCDDYFEDKLENIEYSLYNKGLNEEQVDKVISGRMGLGEIKKLIKI
ncbi:MAG: hypothetical protein IJ574_02860 [Bacilli bacterium]|nr:hypothetical protein [Bacilli bacterium]